MDKKVIKEVKAQIIERQFSDEKTGQVIKYYQVYIPELEKIVKVHFEGLEKKYLGIAI